MERLPQRAKPWTYSSARGRALAEKLAVPAPTSAWSASPISAAETPFSKPRDERVHGAARVHGVPSQGARQPVRRDSDSFGHAQTVAVVTSSSPAELLVRHRLQLASQARSAARLACPLVVAGELFVRHGLQLASQISAACRLNSPPPAAVELVVRFGPQLAIRISGTCRCARCGSGWCARRTATEEVAGTVAERDRHPYGRNGGESREVAGAQAAAEGRVHWDGHRSSPLARDTPRSPWPKTAPTRECLHR